MLHLYHVSFGIDESIARPNRYASERGNWLSFKLLNPEQDVSLVHGLEIEIGTDDAVAVDDRATHIRPDLWSVRGLDGRGRGRGSWQPVQRSDDEVDEVRGADTGQLGHVDIGYASPIPPIPKHQTYLPLEVVTIGLVGIPR